jgi:hypothetical protein
MGILNIKVNIFMKTLLATTLLVVCVTAQATPRERNLQVMCGSKQEWTMTAEKYGEELVMAAPAPNKETIISLWANFITGTSSWVTHVVATDEWCMMGIGDELLIPKDSPLNDKPIGTRTIFK